jgi:hypothetical protein
MSDELLAWHDFYVSLVTASAALLGLLFVALSLHIRALTDPHNAELRSVARSIFLGYVGALGIGFFALLPQTLRALGIEVLVLVVVSTILFAPAARAGLRATGVGFDRNVTILQFVAGVAYVVVSLAAAVGVIAEQPVALYAVAGSAVVGLLWGVFNTWELIFRMQQVGGRDA